MATTNGLIARYARRATWLALPACGALACVRPPEARALAAALIGTIGVAHGANDDAIVSRLAPRFPGRRAGVSAAYGTLAIATVAGARRAPATARHALTALAWFHFGSGDVALDRACAATARAGTPWPEVIVRGALPLFADKRSPWGRAFAAFAAGYALARLAARDGAAALDVALPAATLALTPPLGFAAYFGAWHAPRHLALVLERDTRGGTFRKRFARFAREAAGNTIVALGLGAVAFTFVRDANPHELFVALTLGVTVPHQCAVWYAEREHARTSARVPAGTSPNAAPVYRRL